MVTCIRINVDGSMDEIELIDLNETIRRNTGLNMNEYVPVESIKLDPHLYLKILACNHGGFNMFEFLYGNYLGICFCVLYDELEEEFMSLKINTFIDTYYFQDNLSDFDDLDNSEDSDSYDFDDDFLEDDR